MHMDRAGNLSLDTGTLKWKLSGEKLGGVYGIYKRY